MPEPSEYQNSLKPKCQGDDPLVKIAGYWKLSDQQKYGFTLLRWQKKTENLLIENI